MSEMTLINDSSSSNNKQKYIEIINCLVQPQALLSSIHQAVRKLNSLPSLPPLPSLTPATLNSEYLSVFLCSTVSV